MFPEQFGWGGWSYHCEGELRFGEQQGNLQGLLFSLAVADLMEDRSG